MERMVISAGSLPMPESISTNTAWAKAMKKVLSMSEEEKKERILARENAREGKNIVDVFGNTSKFFDVYDCPICKNKFFTYSYKGDELVAHDCECVKVRKSKLAALNSGLGSLLEKRINNFKTPEKWHKDFKETAIEFMKNNGKGFAALGQSGGGKTHICAAICNYYLGQRKKVYYFNWLTGVRQLGALKFDYAAYDKILSDCENADILYIDDFLKTRDGDILTASEIKIAREIIDIRADKTNGAIIISSECMLNELIEIDSSLAGRLRELCGKYIVMIERTESNNYRWRL